VTGNFLDRSSFPLLLAAAILLLYLAVPFGALIFNLSSDTAARSFTDGKTFSAVATSLVTASISTSVVALLGIPLAYILARARFPGKGVVSLLIAIPLVLPPVTAGILLLLVYGPYGVGGQIAGMRGIALTDSYLGIVLAQVFVSIPFAIFASRAAFEGVEVCYEEAAGIMGASRLQTFWHVALPMARGGILAGLALAWMRAFGEFGATVVLAYHPYSLPVLNYVQLTGFGLASSLPLAALAVVIAAAGLVTLRVVSQVSPTRGW